MTYAATPAVTPRRATLAAPLALGLVAIAGMVRTRGWQRNPCGPAFPLLAGALTCGRRGGRASMAELGLLRVC